MPNDLILIRHGESEANIGLSTDPDSALTPQGVEQAGHLGARLARFDLAGFIALTSPYRRTVHTAAEISRATGLHFVENELVREWGNVATVGGVVYPKETPAHLIARLEQFLTLEQGRRLIVVSHAAPIAVMTQLAWGETPNTEGPFWSGVGNCCFRWLRATRGS